MPRRRKNSIEELDDFFDQDDPVEALADRIAQRLVGTPQVQEAIEGFGSLFDKVGRGIDRAGDLVSKSPRKPSGQTRERIRYKTRIVEKPVETPVDPRQVLGFPKDLQLDRSTVKERQRALALLWHPDKPGGSVEAMQRLNDATDALLREIG